MSEIHFRSDFWPFQIDMQLIFFGKFLTKWLAILDQYGFFIYLFIFLQNGRRLFRFGCSKITFDCISGHFRLIGHFGCLKFIFDSNFGHLRSIQNLFCFSAAILDVRKSLSIAFLAISDRSDILDVRNSLPMSFLAISDPSVS